MGKAEGSWSGMRKYLENEMLAEHLHGRIRYGCTAYVGMDGSHIFEICIDGKQIKRFSWETVNSYFINQGLKGTASDMAGIQGYWCGFTRLLSEIPMQDRTEYTDDEFCSSLAEYRNQAIGESICSENPIVRMFAVLDRRIGTRSLAKIKKDMVKQPEWIQSIYKIRCEAEGIR